MNDEDIWKMTRGTYRMALDVQFRQHPELHGKIFRPKSNAPPWTRTETAWQFSATLLDRAGGYWDLMRDWEAEGL